jgi:peptidoglycan/LPS O-acetylase OafA/YrhL
MRGAATRWSSPLAHLGRAGKKKSICCLLCLVDVSGIPNPQKGETSILKIESGCASLNRSEVIRLKFSIRKTKNQTFVESHGLTIVTSAILLAWIVLYSVSDEHRHLGSFFGNAIADWTGVVVMVLATKHLYERGSDESKKPRGKLTSRTLEILRAHSLSIFLAITGIMWIALYAHADSESKWGQVAGNIVSEWTQIFGLVLLTKKLVETGSKESQDK